MAHATGVVIWLVLHIVHSAMKDAFFATWERWLGPGLEKAVSTYQSQIVSLGRHLGEFL